MVHLLRSLTSLHLKDLRSLRHVESALLLALVYL
jgi:hypothetical protein